MIWGLETQQEIQVILCKLGDPSGESYGRGGVEKKQFPKYLGVGNHKFYQIVCHEWLIKTVVELPAWKHDVKKEGIFIYLPCFVEKAVGIVQSVSSL